MSLAFFIAKRYLFSKKKQHVINIISTIAATGVFVGTMALVVVLSVFNGFDGLIKSYFSTLDPDLKITAKQGKLFDPRLFTDSLFVDIQGIKNYSKIIEENALIRYENRQYIATIKGVSGTFSAITGIDSLMVDGKFIVERNGIPYAVVGQGVTTFLGLNLNFNEPLHIYVPRKGIRVSMNINNELNHDNIFPAGVFSLLEEVDARLVFVPLSFARELTEAGPNVSALELKIENGVSVKQVQKELLKRSGEWFHVKNKYQQHDMLYKTMQSEKWATYLILVFILVIASFNILGSLSMLIIDKKEDIAILRSMGASNHLIRNIFLFEGWLISLFGAIAGVIAGVLVCLAQIYFELVTLPGQGSFVITAYPVEIKPTDLFLIFSVVLGIGFIAAWYPVHIIARQKVFIIGENQT